MRLVWKRLNQLKEQKSVLKNIELRNSEGKNVNTINGILNEMKKHIRSEHYKKPLYPDYLIIEPDLWNKNHDDAVNHIHPKTIKARNESKLQDYLNSRYGSGSVDIMLKLIDNNEIIQAIASLKNRKSVGKDGITAEIIKQNQNWIIPLIKTILHNCQITFDMPKQWLHGITTFIPKGKR